MLIGTSKWVPVTLALTLGTGPVAAKNKAPPPAVIAELGRCRTLAGDAERLRCFDAAVDQLQAAVSTSKVYVLDRTEVQRTRRELFGLPLPKQGVISEAVDDENRIDHLDAMVVSAWQTSSGTWRVTLDNGSTWQQVDDYELARGARKGDKVEIRRALLGSYKMKIGTQPAVRAKRVF